MSRHRILILEDEADVCDIYRLVLEDAGYEVAAVFGDPASAVRWGRSTPPPAPPDLVILDERLGRESGTMFLPVLKGLFPNARFLLATADPDVAAAAVRQGADAAQEKPFPVQDLLRTVADLLV